MEPGVRQSWAGKSSRIYKGMKRIYVYEYGRSYCNIGNYAYVHWNILIHANKLKRSLKFLADEIRILSFFNFERQN